LGKNHFLSGICQKWQNSQFWHNLWFSVLILCLERYVRKNNAFTIKTCKQPVKKFSFGQISSPKMQFLVYKKCCNPTVMQVSNSVNQQHYGGSCKTNSSPVLHR